MIGQAVALTYAPECRGLVVAGPFPSRNYDGGQAVHVRWSDSFVSLVGIANLDFPEVYEQ